MKPTKTRKQTVNKQTHFLPPTKPQTMTTKLTYEIDGLTQGTDMETGETCSGDAIWIGRRNSYDAAINLAKKSAKDYYEVQIRAHDSSTELIHHWYLKFQPNGTITQDQIL